MWVYLSTYILSAQCATVLNGELNLEFEVHSLYFYLFIFYKHLLKMPFNKLLLLFNK